MSQTDRQTDRQTDDSIVPVDYNTACSLNTPFAVSSKRGFSRSPFWTSSSDIDCFL